MLDEVLGAKRI